MEVERPKLPTSFVLIGCAVGVLLAIVAVRWVVGAVLGVVRLGLMIAVIAAVIAVVVHLKPDRD